jgi:F-type H+-transporting ATPase subunit delta
MQKSKQTQREAKQLFRLCLADGRLDEERTRQVTQKIVQSRRRGYLGLLGCMQRLVKLELARHIADVQSAMPLSPDLEFKVQAGLSSKYGPGITTRFTHEPALIGGIRIKVGSDVYDGSVRCRLTALERRF